MKINETGRIGAMNTYKQQQEHRFAGVERKRQTDAVQISEEAKKLMETSRLNDPERANRIEGLKDAVATGTYHVDAGKIAEKLWPFINLK